MAASTIDRAESALRQRWTGYYLRFLAVVLGYGALVHAANILGFGEQPFADAPLAWQVGDVTYAIVNIVGAIGLWRRTAWGVVTFLLAIASQFVIYTLFIDSFAASPEQREIIHGLLGTEAVLVAVLLALVVWRK